MLLRELVENLEKNGVKVMQVTGALDVEIARVVEDSRKVQPGDLFVAKSGPKVNGSDFIADAITRGATALVIDEQAHAHAPATLDARAKASGVQASACIVVNDTALALSILAHAAAGWPARHMKCIGITGTKGKTTVAYLLRSVLRAAGHKVGMIGTVEIDDGQDIIASDMTTPGPLELAALFSKMKANGVTHCVMEVSSHALHQKRVAAIDFNVAIFTNLTGDHLDYHKTMDEYAAAKAILFEGLKPDAVAVLNADDKWAKRMGEKCKAKAIRYGIREWLAPVSRGMDADSSRLDWVGEIVSMTSRGMELQVLGSWNSLGSEQWEKPGRLPIATPLVGKHNVYNLLGVIAGATGCGIDFPTLMRAIEDEDGAPGRLQAVIPPRMNRAEMAFQAFVDYAHTHDSLENALKALRATMLTDGKLICLFGCGGDRDRTKRPKMGAIAEHLADKVIVTSDNPRTENPDAIIEEICTGFSAGWNTTGKITVEPDRRAAIKLAIDMAKPNDVVLIAGKGHENYQIIGSTKHHFDDVEEATAAIKNMLKRELQTTRNA